MNTNLKLNRQFVLPGLRDDVETVSMLPLSCINFDGGGNTYSSSQLRTFDYFDLLPVATTVTAVSDKYTLLLGTNTPLATQSTKGGLTLVTGATSTNIAGVGGIVSTGLSNPITATNGLTFRTRVSFASMATMLATIGLCQTATGIGIGTGANDQAQFIVDPTNSLTATTGATAAQALNWIIGTNVNGTAAYIFTGIPLPAAGQDTELVIQLQPNLTWLYQINNVLQQFTSVASATANSVVKACIGVETLANATASMDIRYVQVDRIAGQ